MSSFSFKQRLNSFRYAWRGACTLLKTQHNSRIHLTATLLVIVVGTACNLHRYEWLFITLAIGLVWAAEAFNSAIEFLADEVTLEKRPRIAYAKDLAALGVLCSALIAVVIGAVVFLPRLIMLFNLK